MSMSERSCEVCELVGEVDDLRAEVKRLRAERKETLRVASLLLRPVMLKLSGLGVDETTIVRATYEWTHADICELAALEDKGASR